MSRILLIAALALAFVFQAVEIESCRGQSTGLDSLDASSFAEMLTDRNEAFQSYSVDFSYTKRVRIGETADTGFEEWSGTGSIVVVGERMRCQMDSDRVGHQGVEYVERQIGVKDGGLINKIQGENDTWLSLAISESMQQMAWPTPFAEFITHYGNYSHKYWVVHKKSVFTSPLAGSSIARVDVGVFTVGTTDRRMRLKFDLAKGGVYAGGVSELKRVTDQDWLAHKKVVCENFDNDNQLGIFVPGRVAYTLLDYNLDVEFETTLELTNWQFPAKITDDTFRLEIPAGIKVNNKITGESYRLAKINDQVLADQLAVSDRISLKATSKDVRSWRVAWLLISTAILLAGYFLLRSKQNTIE